VGVVKEQRIEAALGRFACRRGAGRPAANDCYVGNRHGWPTCAP
jgi:hypothetical protein